MNINSIHIIFDFDGTLWNSTIPVRNSLKFAFKDKGYTSLADNLPIFEIGRPMEIILEEEFHLSSNQAKEVAKLFRIYLAEEDLKNGAFYNNVKEVLTKLSDIGYILSIATFKRSKLVEKILKQHKIDHLFFQVRGLGENGIKSKIDLVKECISIKASKTIMVGDTISDYQAALENNIEFYLVKYGYGYKSLEKKVVSENIKLLNNFEKVLNII